MMDIDDVGRDEENEKLYLQVMRETAKITNQSFPAKDTEAFKNTWYIEDPFDLRHNLAGKMTHNAKKRILL